MTRLLVGLSVGSGREGIDVAAVRVSGLGLSAAVRCEKHVRSAFLPGNRTVRAVADTASAGVRQLVSRVGADLRSVFAVGLLAPFDTLPEMLAEQTGLTVFAGFAERDMAAGGSGRPITAAADFLAGRSDTEDRLLIHLGAVSSVLLLPAGGKISQLVGFDAGPGNRLLDEIASLGSRGKDAFDPGGTRAVQGKCLEDLLTDWRRHPFLLKRPAKSLGSDVFAGPFVTAAFDAARTAGGSLNDLLCTAAHFITGCVGAGGREWLPRPELPRGVYVSGGGVRNGFVWQRLQHQFPDSLLRRTDEIGLPALGRTATAAAGLAALAADGVAGNLPLLTGAAGGRLGGRIVPGDPRHWAAVAGWMAEQGGAYARLKAA